MRWFRPVLGPGPAPGDRFGGRPRAVGPGGWPRCRTCDGPLALVAQLAHDPVRLPLGGDGRVLSLWQCGDDDAGCDTWDAASGANAALVHAAAGNPPGGPAGVVTYPERAVVGWIEGDDGVPPDVLPGFSSVRGFRDLDEASVRAAVPGTCVGGVPFWVHSPDEAPPPPSEFALQLDVAEIWPDGGGPDHLGGQAYVYLDRTDDPPTGTFFWQS